MALRLSTGLRTAMAGTTGFGSTFANGVIYIYSGPQPLTADSAVSGTLLGIVTKDGNAFSFGSPTNGLAFATAASGSITKKLDDVWKFNGIAAGTAGWFRLMGNATDNLSSSTTLPRLDGSIGVTGADLNLSNISIVIGAPTTIDVFQFTIPAQ
jgi:hypothetical protein